MYRPHRYMYKKPNFNELCEENARSGNVHASYILREAEKSGRAPLQVEIDLQRRTVELYEDLGITTYKARTAGGEEKTRTLDDLRNQIKKAEELGTLDGSLAMTYQRAVAIYEKAREIAAKQSVKGENQSVNFLDVLDAFDPIRDAGIIATGMLCLVPDIRDYIAGRQEGLYKVVLGVASHKRSGYSLPVHEPRSNTNGESMISERLMRLLSAIPEPKTVEDEENARALQVLVHQKAEQEVFPLFKKDTQRAFSDLDKLIEREVHPFVRQAYEHLRDNYREYLNFEVPGVNPDFTDPATGEKNVLPSLHQRIGIHGILQNKRFGIWDGGGTGKTAQVILAQPLIESEIRKAGNYFNRAIVVGPGDRFKDAWTRGLIGEDNERYLAKAQDVFVLNGETKTDKLIERMAIAKWIVTSFQQLPTRVNGGDRLLVDVLCDLGADLVVFDEAHNIKSLRTTTKGGASRDPTLTWSAAARQLALQAKYFVPLSATPISNGLNDFAVLYHLINPEELKDPRYFQEKIEGSARKLYTFFHEKSVRRTSEHINEELDWSETIHRLELDKVQREIYDHIVTYRPGNWMAQARKALTDPRLVDPEILKRVGVLGRVSHQNSAKYCQLETLLCSDDGPVAKGEKFVIFSMLMDGVTQKGNANLQRRYMKMEIAEKYERLQLNLSMDSLLCEALKRKYGREFNIGIIDGTVPPEDRARIISELNNGLAGIICTTKTGGESLNFTAANWIYFLDKDYKPDTEEQAIWRVLRKGQKRKVRINHLQARETLEEKLDEYVDCKRIVAKIAMDGYPPTQAEWELLNDNQKEQFKQMVKRSLGGKSIDVYSAEIIDLNDFETKKITAMHKKR